jgi:hypothetical protein
LAVEFAQQDEFTRVDVREACRASDEMRRQQVAGAENGISGLPDGHEQRRWVRQRRAQPFLILPPVRGTFEIRSGENMGWARWHGCILSKNGRR